VEIISHCVWLYHRFPLSLRDVEEMMAQRGVSVSYDTIHQWCRKFGQTYANGLRRHRPRLVTSHRDARTATRFFRKLLTGLEYAPRVLVTDKLASYEVARRRLMPGVEHRRSKYLNNRPRIPISPPASANARYKSSPHRAVRSGFCPRSAGYRRTSGPAATGCMLTSTAARWPSDSPLGTRSSACPPPPYPGHHAATSWTEQPRSPPSPVNLTVPVEITASIS
jgi:putative transposase